MDTRNLTLNLPAELIKQAKVYAAEHDTTVNGLVRRLLEDAVSPQSRKRAAVKRLLELANSGPVSDVDPGTITREEIHERPGFLRH